MKEEKFWILLAKFLSGEADSSEKEELHKLIDGDSKLFHLYEQMKDFWTSYPIQNSQNQHTNDSYLIHVAKLKDMAPEFNDQQIIDFSEVRPSRYKKVFIAISAIAAIIVMIFILQKDDVSNVAKAGKSLNEVTIHPGSRSKIDLPDGTKVWINSGSRFTYNQDFKGETREVYLSGEAYFDVAHDKSRPFIVHTSGIDIRVLGTAFNVKAFDVEPTIEATLIRGKIQVVKKNEPNGSSIILHPHEKLIYNKETETYQSKNEDFRKSKITHAPLKASVMIVPLQSNIPDTAIVETAWLYNKLSFEEERLADLAIRMERWYNVKIIITESNLKNYRISGSFVDETIDQAMKELQLLIPFNYVLRNNEVVISQK